MLMGNRCPLDYRLCDQTVTVYRWDGERIRRQVFPRAFFDYRNTRNVDKTGAKEATSFLLVIPGSPQAVFVGDKVLPGEGPELSTRQDWADLIPSRVPGLVVVSHADPKFYRGTLVHTEAGGRRQKFTCLAQNS